MKSKKTGFTIVELLTVLAIITMLVAMLLPALAAVRNMAKETKQKAQLTTIGLALTTFKNDHGDYPPSNWGPPPPGELTNYCGAQKLAEALLGWDLMGFHPQSAWRADGTDGGLTLQGWGTYNPPTTPIRDVNPNDGIPDTLTERKGPYLERATTNVFRLGNLYMDPSIGTGPLRPETFVLCDVFGVRRMILRSGQVVKAGTPILYYRANTSRKTIEPPATFSNRIYNVFDNRPIIELRSLTKDGSLGKPHRLLQDRPLFRFFYGDPRDLTFIGYIQDPKVTARDWPYRQDSYILISAGADGLYGTNDDIRNFGN